MNVGNHTAPIAPLPLPAELAPPRHVRRREAVIHRLPVIGRVILQRETGLPYAVVKAFARGRLAKGAARTTLEATVERLSKPKVPA